jgi:hypothetical protein
MSNMINMPEGWHDLRSHLCTYLGERLLCMATFGKGRPADMDGDEWTAALKLHGERLYQHGENDGNGDALADDFVGAKESLRWVADNLERLWD